MSIESIERGAAPLAEVIRGDLVESVHLGHVAVVDRHGHLLYAAGNPEALVYTRSALKPLQALPFARADGMGHFGFSTAETALLCASHSGEPRHVAVAAEMLARCGCSAADLQCGEHLPYFYDATGTPAPPPPYSPLAHNCSGKHSGMLACCVLHGWSKGDYLDVAHPLQKAIRAAVARICKVPETALVEGTDGCSAPNYAMPLVALAGAYARLATVSGDDPDPDAGALARLAGGMRQHPEMVSGEKRTDLAFATAGGGDWIAKAGAEGVQAVAVRSLGVGVAIKVADGQARSLSSITTAILDQLGLIDAEARSTLERIALPVLKNVRGIVTGRIQPAVQLIPAVPTAPLDTAGQ